MVNINTLLFDYLSSITNTRHTHTMFTKSMSKITFGLPPKGVRFQPKPLIKRPRSCDEEDDEKWEWEEEEDKPVPPSPSNSPGVGVLLGGLGGDEGDGGFMAPHSRR